MLEFMAIIFLLSIITYIHVHTKGTAMLDPKAAYLISLWMLNIMICIAILSRHLTFFK